MPRVASPQENSTNERAAGIYSLSALFYIHTHYTALSSVSFYFCFMRAFFDPLYTFASYIVVVYNFRFICLIQAVVDTDDRRINKVDNISAKQ